MANDHGEQIRIVQETVAGKEITFAHVMGGPAPIIYQKLGLNPHLDYRSSAIGIMNMTPPESAVIASDIAVKSGNVYLGFADRFTGTLIITGEISDVTSALTEVVDYFKTIGSAFMKRERITREELMERLFHDDYENLKGKKLRMTRVRVPGKEVCMAHIISRSDEVIYQNLGLHIGTHEGENHTGESIGLLRFTPWEAVVVAADVAFKSADVEIGFMDRFCGTLILTGGLTQVQTAVEDVVRFFDERLGFAVCEVHRS